jgi:hypothetical protein
LCPNFLIGHEEVTGPSPSFTPRRLQHGDVVHRITDGTATTLMLSASSEPMTFAQFDPSAHTPWARTTVSSR